MIIKGELTIPITIEIEDEITDFTPESMTITTKIGKITLGDPKLKRLEGVVKTTTREEAEEDVRAKT